MAEYIERQAILDALLHEQYGYLCEDAIKRIPVANVAPVVRCKDCKYCRQTDEFEYWCDGFCSPARLVRKEDFCSHGKARD